MEQKEITVFTEGNSNHSNVWSNIPYFLTTTLESKGYLVHRVNVTGNHILRSFCDKFLCRLLRRIFMKKSSFSYNRSKFYSNEVQHLMKKSVALHPNSCCYISTSFSYAPYLYTVKPCILFCDWTYDYYLKYFLQRKPDFLESPAVIRQDEVIEHASAVFVLFPDVAAYMQQYYHNKNIFYLGNVINAEPFERDIASLSHRQSDANILFIGLKKYKEGADSLIQAIVQLHESVPHITLDIVGMNRNDFANLPTYIRCHGYLNKNIESDKKLYYSLLNHTAMYVNTTPLWAGFSSALEALHYYVPVITTPYPSFVKTFGNSIPFGYYCDENSADAIASYIQQLLTLPLANYEDMCEQAHLFVAEFTWDTYVDRMLDIIHVHHSS